MWKTFQKRQLKGCLSAYRKFSGVENRMSAQYFDTHTKFPLVMIQ